MLVAAIDPSSGASSPVGIVVFEPDSKTILFHAALKPPSKHSKDLHNRIRYLNIRAEEILSAQLDESEKCYCYIESTVMRGASGESLARGTGALVAAVPYFCEQEFVHNTTVKMLVGGHGKSDKLQVAMGVLKWAIDNPESERIVRELINDGQFDVLDAIAIGIAGWMRETRQR